MGTKKTIRTNRTEAVAPGLKLRAAAPRGGPAASDTYLELVRQFPLVPIRDDDHLETAAAVIDQLLEHDLDGGQQAFLDVLTDLVESYEEEHIIIPEASGADALRELMNANRLTQAELQAQTGIAQSTISAVLNGSRSLTREQIATLADRFRVSPAVFFDEAG